MKAVSDNLKTILTEIYNIHEFQSLYVAGGTNLALKYKHRVSTDIDLFEINHEKNIVKYQTVLENHFKNRVLFKSITSDVLRTTIDSIKVDFLNWTAIKKMIKPLETPENTNWKLAHDKDIGAMKLQAIINRGSRKDYYDIAYLIEKYSLKELILAYKEKYQIQSDNAVLKYITDFFEANMEGANTVVPLNYPFNSWEDVKKYIENKVADYIKLKN